jgi:hypothetical protein
MRNMTISQASWTFDQLDGFGMPVIDRDRAASVRLLPKSTGQLVSPAGLGSQDTSVQATFEGTAVCGYRHIADAVAVVKGAFPGTSAWSPPI